MKSANYLNNINGLTRGELAFNLLEVHMMARLLTLLILTSTVAAAQTPLYFRSTEASEATELVFGSSSCGKSISMEWVYQSLGVGTPPCTELKLYVTSLSSCPDTIGATESSLSSASTPISGSRGSIVIDLDDTTLKGFSSDAGCGTPGIEVDHRLCGLTNTLNTQTLSCNSPFKATDFKLTYDAKPPTVPKITSVSNEDKALRIDYSVSSDTVEITAYAREEGAPDFFVAEVASVVESSTFIRIKGLKNAQAYEVNLVATDGAGNTSEASANSSGTPTKTLGFWGVVKESGTTEPGGGCQTTSSTILVGLLFLILRRSFT